MRKTRGILIWALLMICLLATPTAWGSDQGQEQTKSQPAMRFSNGKELGGQWWVMSSLKYDPMPPEWLYHIEASYNLSEATGNFENETHKANALFVLRKNRFSYSTNYILDKQDQTIKAMGFNLKYESQSVNNSLTVDFTPRFYSMVGMVWVRDERIFVENEHTYYGGFGYRILDMQKYQLSVFGAFGHRRLERMFESEVDKADGMYIEQKFFSFLTPTITFNEFFKRLQNLEETNDYYWDLTLGINVKLFGPLSLNLSYMLMSDHRLLPETMRMMPFEKQSTFLMLGLQLSL